MIPVIKIVNTHGVRGEVKALFYTDTTDFFKKVKNLYDKNGVCYVVSSAREHKGAVIIKFASVDTVEDAQKLRNQELFAKKEDFPALPEGRFYVGDLKGLSVFLESGEKVGVVTDVYSLGNDIFEIEKENGKKVLVPFVESFVKEVCLQEKRLVISPIGGLLDNEI